MMDCPTSENLQPKEEEEEEQEKGRTGSLYLHLLSASLEGNFSEFYQINSSSSEEANFNQKPKLIPTTKTLTNLPNIGFGSAICDSILYLFGGWKNEDGDCMDWSNKACYLDSSNNVFVPLGHTMNAVRICPVTVTIGKKIYIFGSQLPGYGAFSVLDEFSLKWAEVFNTEDKLFKLISPPPDIFCTRRSRIGVVALIEEKNKILIATGNFSDWFIYDVETDQWSHTARDTFSPFRLWSIKSPVIDKYIFLYGGGKVCAFDKDKNQFLKNNISLLEYTFFGNEEEEALLHGVIHHLGGWKFCVVFNEEDGYVVRFVYVVSFEIENPERCCGELNIKAGTINVVDHVLRGQTFVDSLLLWSNQIVPSGNPNNNGKRSLKSNPIIVGGSSSVMSHVDEDCMMDDDYGATSRRPDLSKLHRNVAELSRLRRKEAALDKEMSEMRKEMEKLKDKLINIHTSEHNFYLDKLERWEREEGVSKTNMDECVKNENVSEIKTGCVLEEISSIEEKVEAQLRERTELMLMLGHARSLGRLV